MPKELDFENLRFCLDNYTPTQLFIRLIGSKGGNIKVSEKLESKLLDFRKDGSGLYFSVDTKDVFHFPLEGYDEDDTKGFSLAYERIEEVDGHEKLVVLGRGVNPNDPKLPEPKKSVLRHVLDDHLVEITFKGRINIEFHSWWIKPHWKYWTVVK